MDPFITGSLIMAGGNLLGGLFDDDEGIPGSGGGIAYLEEYPWVGPMLEEAAGYSTNVLKGATSGRFAPWYESAMPLIRENMKRGLYETYYGRPGDRTGVIQAGVEAGAMTGVGPKATTANFNKALARYEADARAIDEYLYGKGIDITNEQTKAALNYTAIAPRARSYVQYGGYAPTPPSSTLTDSFSTLARAYGAGMAYKKSGSPSYSYSDEYGYGYGLSPQNQITGKSIYDPTGGNIYSNPNQYSSAPPSYSPQYAKYGANYSGSTRLRPNALMTPLTEDEIYYGWI